MLAELPKLVQERIAEELIAASREDALWLMMDMLTTRSIIPDELDEIEGERQYGDYAALRDLASLSATSRGTTAMGRSAARELRVEVGLDGEQHMWTARMHVRKRMERSLGAATAAVALPERSLPPPGVLRAKIEAATGEAVLETVDGRQDRKWEMEGMMRKLGYYPRTTSEDAEKYIDGAAKKTLSSAVRSTADEWDERYGEDWRERVYKSRLSCLEALESRREGDATIARCVCSCMEIPMHTGNAVEGRWIRRGCGHHWEEDGDGDEVICIGGGRRRYWRICGEEKRPVEFRCGCAFLGEEEIEV
jgi:hypothetical protein